MNRIPFAEFSHDRANWLRYLKVSQSCLNTLGKFFILTYDSSQPGKAFGRGETSTSI